MPLSSTSTDDDSVGAAVAAIEADPGTLDVLVNNAGVYGAPTGVADYDLDEAHDVFETNLFGPWRMTQARCRCCAAATRRGSSTSRAAAGSSPTWAAARRPTGSRRRR